MSPTRGSGNPSIACSAATMRSHASAISSPPPSATPFTAAITGFSRSVRDVMPAKPLRGMRGIPCIAVHLRSLPAEKAFSPAPVTTATRMSPSSAKSFQQASSSSCAGGWSAFITSGRFKVR